MMAKRRTIEEDETALQKKIGPLLSKTDNPEADPNLRALRKRLKRTQRKINSRAARITQAAGKKGKTA